ncbi:MAG: hypothetical protein Kow0069_04430 [Promethearchaeota archaeon]
MAIKGMKVAAVRWVGWILCLLGLGMTVYNFTLLSTGHGPTGVWAMVTFVSLTLAVLLANIEMEVVKKYQRQVYLGLVVVNVVLGLGLARAYHLLALLFWVNLACLTFVVKNERENFEEKKKVVGVLLLAINGVLDVVGLASFPAFTLQFLLYLAGALAAFVSWNYVLSIFWNEKKRCAVAQAAFQAIGWIFGGSLVGTGISGTLLLAPLFAVAGFFVTLAAERVMIARKHLVYIK